MAANISNATLRRIALKALTKCADSPPDGLAGYAKQCHVASLRIVRHPDMPANARVVRGWCHGVGSQHSWVVIGDPYNPKTIIIDATRWSYTGAVPSIIVTAYSGNHTPHGAGSIWDFGRPEYPTPGAKPEHRKPASIKPPKDGWTQEALDFMNLVGPLDIWGWGSLASRFPVGGWPAAEIIEAMYWDKRFSALVPIDKLGMLTNLNPGGLYLRGPDKSKAAP